MNQQKRKVVALLSGGKDSLYNMFLSIKEGHDVVAIANLKPPHDEQDEIDSFMYQTVGHQAIEYIAKSLEKPLFRTNITRIPKTTELEYEENPADEVEDLYAILHDIKHKHEIDFDAVSVGAIASTYQKLRVENLCARLSIGMLAYLWNVDQDELLQRMIDDNFNAILIKVACIGLGKSDVGKSIKEMQPKLRLLQQQYQVNICGEGGEYESLVLDCPLYTKSLVIEECEILCHSGNGDIAPVYYMSPKRISLIDKNA